MKLQMVMLLTKYSLIFFSFSIRYLGGRKQEFGEPRYRMGRNKRDQNDLITLVEFIQANGMTLALASLEALVLVVPNKGQKADKPYRIQSLTGKEKVEVVSLKGEAQSSEVVHDNKSLPAPTGCCEKGRHGLTGWVVDSSLSLSKVY